MRPKLVFEARREYSYSKELSMQSDWACGVLEGRLSLYKKVNEIYLKRSAALIAAQSGGALLF